MIQDTTEFLTTVRDIYLYLNKNYSDLLLLDDLKRETVDLKNIFHPAQLEIFLNDLVSIKGVKVDDYSGKNIDFIDEFDFTLSDQQKSYGTDLVVQEIAHTISQMKKKKGAITVASLGIGNGETCCQYANSLDLRSGDSIIGIDLHSKYLAEASQRIPGLQEYEFDFNSITPSRMNQLPIADSSVDIAECIMVAHHIENLPSFIREVSRLLVSGGVFFFADLIDKTCLEDYMIFHSDHEYPAFHGVEFFRNHDILKDIISHYMILSDYVRVGPGIACLVAVNK